jgi:hypothetical protein
MIACPVADDHGIDLLIRRGQLDWMRRYRKGGERHAGQRRAEWFAMIDRLDAISRTRALSEAESVRLERLIERTALFR